MKVRYSMLPRCIPEDDYMVFQELKYNEYGEATAAYIYNQDSSIKIEIFISDYLIKNSNHKNMYLCLDHKHYLTESFIAISTSFYNEIIENDYLMALIWHEVGHFHSMPYLSTSEENIPEQRRRALENGEVILEERVADVFAVSRVGKDDVIKSLKYMRKKRKEETNPIMDKNYFFAEREFTERIKYIRAMEEEKALDIFYKLISENSNNWGSEMGEIIALRKNVV